MSGDRRRATLTAIAVFVVGLGLARPAPPEAAGPGPASRVIEPLEEPSAVALGSDGSIYVCEAGRHRVSAFDRTGAPLRQWGRLGTGEREFDGPRGIAVAEDGRVYVADTGNDRIQVFTPDGRFERQWGRHGSGAGEFDEPMGLAVLGERLFVADSRNNRVQVFLRDGHFLLYVWSYGYHEGGFDRPVDVAVDRDGSFYVSDQGNSRIQRFTADGRFALAFGGRGRRGGLLVEPGGLDACEGRLIVADPFTHRLVIFDRSGALLREGSVGAEDGSRGIDAPSSVACRPSGNELVVCSAVEDRCQIVSSEAELGSAPDGGSRRIAREGYAVGGTGEAIVVASRETGVPFIVDTSRQSPSLVVTLGGPGREPGEFMRPAGFDLDLKREAIVVSDGGNARLQSLRLGHPPADPRRFDPARTVYVLGIGLDDQERLDIEPGGWALDPATLEPGAMVRDPRRRLVVVDTAWRRIVVLDDRFHLASSWGGFGDEDGRFRKPVGLAVDAAGGSLYVLDAGRRRVQVFDLDGHLRFAWGGLGEGPGEFVAPSGISTAKDGSVYVVDRGANRVQRFDRRGVLLSAWGSAGAGPGQFRRPEAIHVDGGGRVIVIDSGNRRAQAFTARGQFLWEMPLDPTKIAATGPLRLKPVRSAASRDERPNDCPTSIVSNAGRYSVCVTTVPDPVPRNGPFGMSVSVYENSGARGLAQKVILDVDATMPEHHHGMNLKPQVRAIDGPAMQDLRPGHGARGNGRFEVGGMLFHMPGRWEIHFDITHGAITERAQLELDLDDPTVTFSEDERRRILELSPLGPPPADPSNAVADNDAAARLGHRLYFEKRLSSGGVSCAACHVPAHGFTDGKRLSEGVGRGRRHTPTLWNVGYNRWFFWDGRADSLWSQALSPLESETEMAGDRSQAAHLLADEPAYRIAYESVFGPLPDLSVASRFPAAGHPVPGRPEDARSVAWSGMREQDRAAVDTVFANLGKAIAAYERRLVSRQARFDRFAAALRAGEDDPEFSIAARRGLRLFVGRGRCRVCHAGPNFTDGEFHSTGVPPLDEAGRLDAGRQAGIALLLASPFNLQGRFSDDQSGTSGELLKYLRKAPETWGQFKTPSLRNVARVAPYMHQGQFATVRDVLEFYSTRAGTADPAASGERILKPLQLSPGEIDDLAAFLESLTDESIDPEFLRAPGDGPASTREVSPHACRDARAGGIKESPNQP